MFVALIPTHAEAKTSALHTVFSEKQINERIREIRDYYYNKPKQLTIKKQKVVLGNEAFTISYYIHGKDLMFGYGSSGKKEYRLYFYKNQLIRLLVDASGKARKTYTQLYKKLEKTFYDAVLDQYMRLENYARKEMGSYYAAKKKILDKQSVIIAKISGNEITYHKVACYGSDGCMWSIDTTAYKAKVGSSVKIKDYSSDPMTATDRSLKWLKREVSSPYLGLMVDLAKKGNVVSKISVSYTP